MPTMPSVGGLPLAEAEFALQQAGVINLTTLGYFTPWPVSAVWVKSVQAPGIVLAQSPGQGTIVNENSPVTLTLAAFQLGVAFP